MRLKSLQLSGFKSFAKKTELEFKTSITAIVGPNGSGKSNVAEAFRFVLGEQSMKSMRSKRSEDLIFNGSQTVPRSGRASVKIKLDNRDKLFKIDFGEIEVERVTHRDASNEYLINGSPARLKDVQELVTSANVGPTGHHIISQGEADRVLSISNKERKLLIEDALGLKIYHYRKIESQRKLERTRENLDKIESLRREIAPHLKFLRKQVEKIEAAREMAKELEGLYKEYFKRESAYLDHHKSLWRKALEEPERKLSEVEKALAQAREAVQKEDVSSDLLPMLEEADKKITAMREEKNEILRSIGRLEGEIASGEKALERERRLEEKYASQTVSLASVTSLQKEVEGLFDQGQNKSVVEIASLIKGLFEKFFSSFAKASTVEVSQESLDNIEQKRAEKKEREAYLQNVLSKERGAETEREALRNKIDNEKDEYKEAEKEAYRLQAIRSDVTARIEDLRGKLERLALEEEEFKRELGEAGALVGRRASEHGDVSLADESGRPLTTQDLVSEERGRQYDRKKAIEKLKIKLEDFGAGSSEETLREYQETTERDEFLAKEVEDLEAASIKLEGLIVELEQTLNHKFKEGIKLINEQFGTFFTLMFGGGKASLDIVVEQKKRKKDTDLEINMEDDPTDREEEPGEEGVEIAALLPHKKIKGLDMLSGGERALTSIALLFAMSSVNPPPFIILDETDAALDEANSRRYGDLIEKLSERSQLILITHNRETMSRAGVLYGVTMGSDGISKLLSVEFEEAVKVAK